MILHLNSSGIDSALRSFYCKMLSVSRKLTRVVGSDRRAKSYIYPVMTVNGNDGQS